jgi:hypothetical protein
MADLQWGESLSSQLRSMRRNSSAGSKTEPRERRRKIAVIRSPQTTTLRFTRLGCTCRGCWYDPFRIRHKASRTTRPQSRQLPTVSGDRKRLYADLRSERG